MEVINKELEYKGFRGKLEYSEEDDIFYGTITNIDDLVTYECDSPDDFEREFEEAVEDYIELCKEVGKSLKLN